MLASYKVRMFNRKASSRTSCPEQIVETLALQPGQTIADIGAGGGYFSLRFAKLVGSQGHVYSLDTNRDSLEFIDNSADEKGLRNVTTILVREDNELPLPKNSIDLIFMRNLCHHLPNRMEHFRKLREVLKTEGEVAVIEYRSNSGGRFSFHRLFGHYVPQEIIIREMFEAGFKLQEEFDFLPEQSFTIFRMK